MCNAKDVYCKCDCRSVYVTNFQFYFCFQFEIMTFTSNSKFKNQCKKLKLTSAMRKICNYYLLQI